MKKLILTLISLSLAGVVSAQYLETFDTNSANWTYGYGASYTPGTTTWNSSGGNPAGHISGASEDLYAVWTYETAVFGDMRGLSISVDTKISHASTGGDAQFYIGRGGTYYISSTWDIANNEDWTTYSTPLDTNSMARWGSGGSDSLDYVLEAPDDIGIFFGASLASGSGDLLLDNFGTLSEPVQIQLKEDIAFADLNTPVLIDVLANDGLLSSYAVSAVTQPLHGSVTLSTNRSSVIYSPDSGFLGEETFTYTTTNGVNSASTNVTVTVIAPSSSMTPPVLNGSNTTTIISVRSARTPSVQTRHDMIEGSWTNLPDTGTNLPRVVEFIQTPEDPNNYTIELLMNPDHSQDFFRVIVPN